MPPQGAYSGGLFDAQGPFKFAEAVGTIPTELDKIVASFTNLDTKSSAALQNIEDRLNRIVGLTGQMGNLGGPGGATGGSRATWGSPTSGPPPSGGTGGQPGNQMGVGGRGNAPSQYTPQTTGPNGGVQPSRTTGALTTAGVAFSALGGAAERNLTGRMADITAEDLYGNLAARTVGLYSRANQNRFSIIPRGQLAQSGADFATAQAAAQMGLGTTPLGSSFGQANQAGVNQFLNAGQWLAPGASRTELAQGLTTMFSGQSMQAALGTLGINMQQNGQQMNPQQVFDAIVNRAINGGFAALAKLPPDLVAEALRPGYALYATAMTIFAGDQTMWQAFSNYVLSKVGGMRSTNPAQQNANPMTAAGAATLGLTKTMQQAQLGKTSAAAAAQSQLTPGTSSATQTMDHAATTFYNAVNNFIKGTGAGGFLGQAQTYLGGLGGILGGGLGGLGGLLGMGGGGGGGSGGTGAASGGGGLGGVGSLLELGGGALGISKILRLGGGAAGAAGAAGAGGAAGGAAAAAPVATAATAAGGGAAAGLFGTAGVFALGAGASLGIDKISEATGKKAQSMLGGTLGAGANLGLNVGGLVTNPIAAPTSLKRIWKTGKAFFNDLFGGGSSSPADKSAGPSGTVPQNATGVPNMVKALYNAGFRGQALINMVSYGISESGGNSSVLNDNPSTGDYSVGWFQINYFGNLKSGRTAKYGDPTALRSNPQGQANAAWDLSSHGTNFGPWMGDILNGHFAQNLGAAQAAVKAAGYARGTYDVATTQLALLHKGERVIPAAENYSNRGRYSRAAQNSGGNALHLNFQPGSIQLGSGVTQDDAKSFVNMITQEMDKKGLLTRIGQG